MTLAQIRTELDLLLRTRGAREHTGGDLNALIGRALIDFVEQVRPHYYHDLRATVTSASAGVLNLSTTDFSAGSLTVKAIQLSDIWIVAGSDLLAHSDMATIRANFPTWFDDTGVPSRWFTSSQSTIHVHPRPTVDTPIRASGFHYSPEIVSGSGDGAEVVLPTDCTTAFIYFAAIHLLRAISDGASASILGQLERESLRQMRDLKGKYRTGTPSNLGYIEGGTAMRIGSY